MTFNLPVTSGQYTKLRSNRYAGRYLISLFSNEVIFAAQNASDLAFAQTWALFLYNNVTVGNYSNIEVGMAILMGDEDDIAKATWRGRIRELDGAQLEIRVGESSRDFLPGSFFWIVNSFDMTVRQSRPVDLGGGNVVRKVDYDEDYHNDAPEAPTLKMAYADRCSATTGKYRIAFNVSDAYHPDPARSISSYQWTFKAGSYTVISGSLSSAVVTVDFDPGEQFGKLVITDNVGVQLERRFGIKAHDDDYPPDTGFEGLSISADMSKPWSLSADAFTDEQSSTLNRTYCIVWRDTSTEVYGSTVGALGATGNVAFVGWLQRENDTLSPDLTYTVLADSKLEFISPGVALSRLTAQQIPYTLTASPAQWGEFSSLTWWQAAIHYLQTETTAGMLCGIDSNDKTQTFLFPAMSAQGQNALEALQFICNADNAVVEFSPDGLIGLNIKAEYAPISGVGEAPTIAAFTSADISGSGATYTSEPGNVGKVDGDGGFYSTTQATVTPFTVRAPGHAQDEGQDSATLSGQILAATNDQYAALLELRLRVGTALLISQTQVYLDIDHPDGYTFLIPSQAQYYTWDLDETIVNNTGIHRIIVTPDMLWVLESVTYTPGANGTCGVKARYRLTSPVGDPGDDTTKIVVGQLEPPIPDFHLPAFNFQLPEVRFPDRGLTLAQVNPAHLLPPKGQIATKDGQYVLVWTATNVYWLRNFITLQKPQSRQVTPNDL